MLRPVAKASLRPLDPLSLNFAFSMSSYTFGIPLSTLRQKQEQVRAKAGQRT